MGEPGPVVAPGSPSPPVRRRLGRAVAVAALASLFVLAAAVLVARHFLAPGTLRPLLEAQATRALGRPVRIGGVRAALFPRVGLQLSDVEVGTPALARAGRIEVSTGLRGLLSRRVEQADVTFADAWLDVPRLATPAPAVAKARAGAAAASAAPPAITVAEVRSIRLRAVELRGRGKALRVDLHGALAGDRLDVPDLELASGRTRLSGKLALTSVAARNGTFALEGALLDLDELTTVLASLAPDTARGKTPPPAASALAGRVDGTLAAAAGRIGGLEFRGLEADVRVAGSAVTLDPLRFAFYDGSYQGSLRVDASGRLPRVAFKGRLERVDVAALARALDSKAGASGRLTVSLDVSGGGDDAASAMRSAVGRGELHIDDGRLAGLDLVHDALAFLGAAPAGAGERDGFTRLRAGLTLGEGRLRSDDLEMKAPDFDLHGRGSLDLEGRLDVRAELVLAAALSAAAERSVNELAYAREGDRIVLPLRISGTTASPQVTIDAEAAAKRAARRGAEEAGRKLLRGLFGK